MLPRRPNIGNYILVFNLTESIRKSLHGINLNNFKSYAWEVIFYSYFFFEESNKPSEGKADPKEDLKAKIERHRKKVD